MQLYTSKSDVIRELFVPREACLAKMNEILVKQLALALDKRLAVFAGCVRDDSILEKPMEMNSAVFMITEILRPCCCMVCNIGALESILQATKVFANNELVIKNMAKKIYDELARMNGLG